MLIDPIHFCLLPGFVNGAGCGYSINAQFRIATETTSFAMPESLIGYITNSGASYFFPRKIINKELGMYLAITGRSVFGEDVVKYGFATHYIKQ